jgi:predicted nucleic acid-binding protein
VWRSVQRIRSPGRILPETPGWINRPCAAGKAMPIKDSLIAATALVHELIVVTRNRSDFATAGVRVLDPFVGS